jgi:predicted O-methyltransferase YrrM
MDKNPLYPPLVNEAIKLAERLGFLHEKELDHDSSCIPEMGHLLRTLAAAKPAGRLAEAGTGCGVGTAWMESALTNDSSLLSVEIDEERAAAVANLFRDKALVEICHGDSKEILPRRGPFDLLYFDGLGTADDLLPANASFLIELVRVGGFIVFDDIPTGANLGEHLPSDLWTVRKLEFAFGHDRLSSQIVRLTPEWSGLFATRLY